MRRVYDRSKYITVAGVASAALLLSLSGCGRSEPQADASPPIMRRLTQDQYKNIIRDAFGSDITFGGRMDPDLRLDGLMALGTAEATITAASFEQYDSLARSIAAQIMEPRRREVLFACDPGHDGALDETCVKTIVQQTGRALFRRPLTDEQQDRYLGVTKAAAEHLGDAYKGMQYGLSTMLASPSFLFQKERVEPAGKAADEKRLDPYSKASRLSFFLWDSGPDEKLLAAAEAGELQSEAGLRKQVDRMIASPRLENGVRAFFKDYLQLSLFEGVGKDSVIYPKFSPVVALDAPEQTLRTITYHLIDKQEDYRDLFTTRATFMSRALGVVYQVPVEADEAWVPYEFEADDPRAGLLSQLSFTALYSLPGRSSPTQRRKAVREILMCQPVPIPPANVDFSQFENANHAGHNTARARLTAHATDPVCAGCHKIIDPIGLGLENLDGLGAMRETEGGMPIDPSGSLDGVAFSGPATLGKALHDNPNVPACVVRQLYAYGTGRTPGKNEAELLKYLSQGFASDGYKFTALLRRVALSDNFYRVTAPPAEASSAAADSPRQNR